MGVVLELISMNKGPEFNQLQLWVNARMYTVWSDGSVASREEAASEPTIDTAKDIPNGQNWRLPVIAWLNFFPVNIFDDKEPSSLGESLIAVELDEDDGYTLEPASGVVEKNDVSKYTAWWLCRVAEGDEHLVPDKYEELLSITENY